MNIRVPDIVLLGGSFNPLHIMHLRMAVEVMEAMHPQQLLFIPSAEPPHKPDSGLLPFGDRLRIVQEAIAGFSQFAVSDIEAHREGPSYTIDTIRALQREEPSARFGFIMGSEDLASLPTWREWRKLAFATDLILVYRGRAGLGRVAGMVTDLWPGASFLGLELHPDGRGLKASILPADFIADRTPEGGELVTGLSVFFLPGGGRIFFVAIPRMEISSSLVRERWLAGRRVDYLIPPSVAGYLQQNAVQAREIWSAFSR